MARRFGRFNKNQKRDRRGRWTKGGGASSSKSSSKKKGPNYKTGQLSNGAILLTTQNPNKYTQRGSNLGAVVGFAAGVVAGKPLGGTGVGILAGASVGRAIDNRVNKRRLNAAEAALQRSRRR